MAEIAHADLVAAVRAYVGMPDIPVPDYQVQGMRRAFLAAASGEPCAELVEARQTIDDLREQGRIQAVELTDRSRIIDELQALVARMEQAAAIADEEDDDLNARTLYADDDQDGQCTRELIHGEPGIGSRVFNHDSGIWTRTTSGWVQSAAPIKPSRAWTWVELRETFDGHLHADRRAEAPSPSPEIRESKGCGCDEEDRHVCLREATEAEMMLGEVREVPASEVRAGDHVTVSGIFRHADGDVQDNEVYISSGLINGDLPFVLKGPTIGVARSVTPLPDKPGSVGTATVQGVEDVRVALRRATDGRLVWIVLDTYPDNLPPTVPADQITDYQSLLDGQAVAEENS